MMLSLESQAAARPRGAAGWADLAGGVAPCEHAPRRRQRTGLAARRARRDRSRADSLAREVRDHADERHDHPPDVAVPARCRVGQPARGVVERRRRTLLLEHDRDRVRFVAHADHRRHDRWLRALRAASEVRQGPDRDAARDALRACGRAARAALHRDRPSAAHPSHVHRHVLGGVAAGRRERLQRHPREAVLRQPAARDLRGGPHRRRGAVPSVHEDRVAVVAADPRRRLRLRGARVLEGLPLAAARSPRPEQAAAIGAACRRSSRRPSSACSSLRCSSRASSRSQGSSSSSVRSCAGRASAARSRVRRHTGVYGTDRVSGRLEDLRRRYACRGRPRARDSRRRVHGVRRPVRLWQDDGAADGRRSRGDQ